MRSNLITKINKDPYFSKVYSFYGQEKPILEAGFFDNKQPSSKYLKKQDNSFLVTPLSKIKTNLKRFRSKTKPLVLLTTGAFSPVHEGHIKMMEIAKKTLEEKGRTVVGGYISPSHNDYLRNKYKQGFLSSSERIYLVQKEVDKSNWLMADPWESLFNNGEVTYTEVIIRLKKYLRHHFKIPFEIAYVFGSDNANFARAFIFKGLGVCIQRPGYEKKMENVSGERIMKNNSNIIFIKIPGKRISSSSMAKAPQLSSKNKKRYVYAVREDSDYSLSKWQDRKGLDQSAKCFSKGFEEILKNVFMDYQVYPCFIKLSGQQDFVKKVAGEGKLINLDVCTKGGIKVDLSRLFNLSDGQISAEKLITRPGYIEFKKRLSKIPKGEYNVVDDDTVTRRTLSSLEEFIPKGVNIRKVISLLDIALKNSDYAKGYEIFDVVDLRDFIAGSKNGGLVVSLPNGRIGRSPYCLPYVSSVARAKIPPAQELEFSLQMWKLNKVFFDKLKPKIILADTDKSFQKLMKYVGFSRNSTMNGICGWHIKYLGVFLNK